MDKTKSQQAQEYAEKKNDERLSAYPEAIRPDLHPEYDTYDIAQAYLDGYTAAEQSMTDSEATVIQVWVACDKGGMVRLHYTEPKRTDGGYWQGGFKSTYLPKGKFPSLTWSDEPLEVELTIKPKKR